ncbi:cytochrome c [Temperatibacter marinus]|uniref:Cytochrome c n=1 Tax=Temperatibacter marinus TaxID=1456591 RepID=A0AA52EGE2_9PROT|nr:cytochrome c [Temperatibacter marinus]WND02305.1 cytochrome c [Temperatibacter marinus]
MKKISIACLFLIFSGGGILVGSYFIKTTQTYEKQGRTFAYRGGDKENGKRQAQLRGCSLGCHGKNSEGAPYDGFAAPNLTGLFKDYSAEAIESVLRQGIRADGTALYKMPSSTFQYITDQDLSDLIAYYRSIPRLKDAVTYRKISLTKMMQISIGDIQPVVVGATNQKRYNRPAYDEQGNMTGHYIAHSICAECHGQTLEDGFAPSLRIVTTYQLTDLTKLLTLGEAPEGRPTDLMKYMGAVHYPAFKQQEMTNLFEYLNMELFLETHE